MLYKIDEVTLCGFSLLWLVWSLTSFYVCSIGRIGPTKYLVGPSRVTARVTAERPSPICDYDRSKNHHLPGISSLIFTLEICCVTLLFALPYMEILSAFDGSPRVTAGHRLPCLSPGAVVSLQWPLFHTQSIDSIQTTQAS